MTESTNGSSVRAGFAPDGAQLGSSCERLGPFNFLEYPTPTDGFRFWTLEASFVDAFDYA